MNEYQIQADNTIMLIEGHKDSKVQLKKLIIRHLKIHTILLFLIICMGHTAFAQQTYDTPCAAEAMPIDGWNPMDQTQNVRGDLTGASPFITANAGGTQDFGCTGSENAVFYKVEFDPTATRFSITYNSGTATNISVAVFSLSSTECGGGTAFGESVYLDAAGNEMVNCDLNGNTPVTFDLCDFTTTDFNNLYVWLSTSPSDEGTFNIDINQYVRPVNDDCVNATDVSQTTGSGEQCLEFNNFGACSDVISLTMRPDPSEEDCFFNIPANPSTAGVWVEFTTDGNAGLVDLSFLHTNNQDITAGLYAADPDCNNVIPVECWTDNNADGVIDNIENIRIESNSTYYIYMYTEKSVAGSILMCIEVKEPLPCGDFHSFYNFPSPVCNMSVLNNYCLNMQSNPDYRSHEWPGGCPNRETVENPNWFTFVAGSNQTILEFEVSNCQNSLGVEIGVFELPCEDMLGLQFPGIPPAYPERLKLLSDCSHITCYNDDTVQVEIETYSGGLYGVMIDGCSGDECDIEINVIEGEDAPDISGSAGVDIVLDNPISSFEKDTICIGAQDIDLYLENEIDGACAYIWYLIGGGTEWTRDISKTYDFPNAGSYYFQVYGTNYCSTTDIISKEIVAVDLPPFETRDTICEGDSYTWIGPYGNEIVPTPSIDSDFHGNYVYRGNTENDFGCPQSGTLLLYVRDENDEYPTIIDSNVCAEELPVTIKGVDFSGSVNDVIISQPLANHGCDTFFSVNLTVLGGPFFIRPECDELGNVIFRFEEVGGPQTSWYEQFALYNDPNNDYSLISEFIAVEKDSVISDSLPMTLSQREIEELAENGALNVRLRLIIKYMGDTVCTSISPPVEFDLDDNFPRINRILGDTAYCPGQELELFADVHHPLSPAPFGEFPDSIGFYSWNPPIGFTVDSNSFLTRDTLIINSPSSPSDNTICLAVTTERCLFTDTLCQELVIDEPIQPILEEDNETCDTMWSFTPDTTEEGAWSVLAYPPNGNTASFSDTTDPNATVTIDEPGTYTFLWREGAPSCAKYDSVTIDFLESTIRPVLSDTCYDLDFVVEVILTNGRGGYTIHPSSTISGTITDSTFTSDPIPIDMGPGGNLGDVLYLIVEDSLGCVSDPIPIRLVCNCESEIGEMSSEDIDLCEGETAFSDYLGGHTNDGTDTIMFILHSGSLSELEGIVDTSLSGDFPFTTDIILGQTYYISAVIGNAVGPYVDLDDPCLQVARGQAVTWHEIPETLAGMNDTLCGLEGQLNGTSSVGNYNWKVVSGPGTVNFGNTSDPVTNVSVSEPGSYIFRAIEQNDVCVDSADVAITFLGDIEYQRYYECDSAATSYVATIVLSGGGNNYTLISGDGSITMDTLRTNPIPKGESRVLVYDSEYGCGPDSIEVESDCECLTQIGSFETDTTIIACEENCINVTSFYNSIGESLDGNDIGRFILHTSADTIIQNEIIQSANGEFCYADFQSIVDLGDTVYAAYVIGNNNGMNEVDLSDPCLQVTYGAAVVFVAAPNANAGMDESTCGLSFGLDATLGSGTGMWTFIQGTSQNVVISSDTDPNTTIEVDQSGTYLFEWEVVENDCIDRDTVEITFLDIPEINNFDIECDSTGSNYVVSFTISGGEPSSYSVNGNDGVLNGDVFNSEPIPTDSAYRFIITDGNNCDSIILSDDHDCSCITEIGSLTGEEQILCEDESVVGISYDPSGETRDGNDELLFAIVDEDGNVLITSDNPDFSFDPAVLDIGTTYFIRVYLGSVVNGEFQFDESCTEYVGMIPVTWYAYPEAIVSLMDDSITCSNSMLNIDGSASIGQNLSFNWSSTDGTIESGTEQLPVAVVTSSGLYTLTITDTVSGCANDTTIQIFQSDDVPRAEILPPDSLNCEMRELVLDGSSSSQGQDITYEWSTLNGNITSDVNQMTVTIDRAGTYTLTVTNNANDCNAEAMVTVTENVNPPTVVAEALGLISCNTPQATISGEGSSTGNEFTYLWSTQNGNISSNPGNRDITVSSGGDYLFVVTNENNGCKDSVTVKVEEEDDVLNDLEVTAKGPTCFGEMNGNIQVEPIGGVEPFAYRLNGGSEQSTGIFDNLGAGQHILEVEDANGCLIRDTIILDNPPELNISLTDVIEIEEGDSVVIEAVIPGMVVYDTIIWDTENVFFECLNPECTIIQLYPPENMTIEVTISGGMSCSDQDSTYIIVQEVTEETSLYIPNVFSPNGDGINDIFIPETGRNVNRIEFMQIFDRWGDLIFESRNFKPGISTEGWDGRFHGERLSPGVFTYIVKVEYITGETEYFTGSVTLIN